GGELWEGWWGGMEGREGAGERRFDSNAKRVERRDELVPMLETLFPARTTAEWLERLQGHGVPVAPINTVDRVVSDPQVQLRGMVVDLEHPTLGTLKTLRTPVRLEGAPFPPPPPSTLGHHTQSVLRELLAYPPERIEALRHRRVIV